MADLTVNAVARAVAILRHLAHSDVPLGPTRIARELGLNPSTCFNILRTLAKEGLVQFDHHGKHYSIGLALVAFAKDILDRESDMASLKPVLEGIARKHQVTTCLMHRMTDSRMIAVIVCMGEGPLRIHMSLGQRLPLLTGAAGRVMAAFSDLPPAALKKQFQDARWARPVTFEAYQLQVAQTRKRGWAIDEGFFIPGAVSVAVPVFDQQGRVRHACSALMFRGQDARKHVATIVSDLVHATSHTGQRNASGRGAVAN